MANLGVIVCVAVLRLLSRGFCCSRSWSDGDVDVDVDSDGDGGKEESKLSRCSSRVVVLISSVQVNKNLGGVNLAGILEDTQRLSPAQRERPQNAGR